MSTLPSRFHCRAIMVRTIEQYCRLLEELKKLGDISVVPIDTLFSGADVMPSYESLTDKAWQDKLLILPGVSEYLRLFHANEETAQRFGSLWHYQWNAATYGRILIPLWGCDTLWYDSALRLCDDERQKEFVYDCSGIGNAQRMSIQVLSGEFEQYMSELQTSHGYASYGLKEWYSIREFLSQAITEQAVWRRASSIYVTLCLCLLMLKSEVMGVFAASPVISLH